MGVVISTIQTLVLDWFFVTQLPAILATGLGTAIAINIANAGDRRYARKHLHPGRSGEKRNRIRALLGLHAVYKQQRESLPSDEPICRRPDCSCRGPIGQEIEDKRPVVRIPITDEDDPAVASPDALAAPVPGISVQDWTDSVHHGGEMSGNPPASDEHLPPTPERVAS